VKLPVFSSFLLRVNQEGNLRPPGNFALSGSLSVTGSAEEINEKLFEIKKNPTHRPLVNDSYLANLGYRIKRIKNYMIFYIIDDNKHIKIVRFLYCKRNWMIILKEMNLEEIFEES